MNPLTLAIVIAAVVSYGVCTIAIVRNIRRRSARTRVRSTPTDARIWGCSPDGATRCLPGAAALRWIEVKDPEGVGHSYPMAAGRIVVGSSPDCDIRVSDPFVSGHHLSVRVDPEGQVCITDLDSTNGTFSDDIRIDRTAIAPGEVVQIGESTLTVLDAGNTAVNRPQAA